MEAGMDSAPVSELRDRLGEIVDDVASSGSAFTVTKHGKPLAVILAYDEYESLIETLNILSDPETMAALDDARSEVAENEFGT
jgi:prevent-host-death family protein